MKVVRIECEKHLHVVVFLVHILQVLLELLQLNEAVVGQLPALLHFTVHFFKLERREGGKIQYFSSMKSRVWKGKY